MRLSDEEGENKELSARRSRELRALRGDSHAHSTSHNTGTVRSELLNAERVRDEDSLRKRLQQA